MAGAQPDHLERLSQAPPDLEAASNPAFGLDQEQRIVFWSEAAEAALGIPAGAAVGRPCYAVIQGRDYFGKPFCRPGCPVFAALMQGHPSARCALEFRQPREPARRIRLRLMVLPSGSPPHVLAFFGDQTPALLELAEFEHLHTQLSVPARLQDFEGMLRAVTQSTEMDVAELFLADWRTGAMTFAEHYGPNARAFHQITEFLPGQGFPGLAAARGEPVITDRLADEPRFIRTWVKDSGFREYVGLPLFGPRRVIGAIGIASRKHHGSFASAANRLASFSRSLGAALSSAILDARDALGDVRFEAGHSPRHNLETLLEHILSRMAAVTGASGAAATVVDPAARKVVCRVVTGRTQDLEVCPVAYATGPCPAMGALRSVVLDSRRDGAPACPEHVRGERPALCLPLAVGGRPLGTVSFWFAEAAPAAPSRYLGVLSAMADRAATLVNNLLVQQETWQAAFAAAQVPPSADGVQEEFQGHPAGLANAGGEGPEGGPVADAAMVLDIRCLGDFRVSRQGQPLPARALVRRKAWTALKVLIANVGQNVHRDVLVECLWPGEETDRGSQRLSVVISALRRALEPAGGPPWLFVRTEGESYAWNSEGPYRLDTQAFRDGIRRGEAQERRGNVRAALESYQAAAGWYQGEFMQDEPYADWCLPQRQVLREQYLGLVNKLAGLLEGQGDRQSAVLAYQRALQFDPLREDLQRRLMRCLWRAGRRDEAVRQYTTFRERLRQELAMDPLPETQHLFDQIASTPSPRR